VGKRESRLLVGKRPLVKAQPSIPILHGRLAGYFSQAVFWEMMALMSAKPTQFSFPLCRSFPVVSSKFYIVIKYALDIQFALFCQPGGGSRTSAKVLTSKTVSPKLSITYPPLTAK